MTELQATALYQYLEARDAMYAGKTLELQETVTGWLTFVSNTFPHYTDHTASHSKELIRQVSGLLFRGADPDQGVVSLSAVEAYILIAAAFLHDAGMVVSDEEKLDLLASEEWLVWVRPGGSGHLRYRQIEDFRAGATPSDVAIRQFLADVQLRYLLAEFVRRTHHARVVPLLAEEEASLGRFAFDDPILLETITAVCVGHGLGHAELEDQYRYPDRRDVRGDEVNVRLMAILLRLGDLLDMSSERACPLLLGAASPLPAESVAHWSQYSRIRHRSTSPDTIEVQAECENADEHRLLQDWCQWLVDEVNQSRALMAGTRRHAGWEPPIARLSGPNPTIDIRPSPGANYIPSQWTFELDAEAVVQRLVTDVSPEHLLFVRELIQNALDAMRCSVYDTIRLQGRDAPSSPVDVDLSMRLEHPLRISLRTESVRNPLSGEEEERQVLRIDDTGVGMTEDIVRRFFLQIGRSFYTTSEFRRTYDFTPTSRFGVGFLSVFRDSDRVEVETATRDDVRDGPGGLRLSLTGPRNYLLTERANRATAGTAISVHLQRPLAPDELTQYVEALCRRVEFPIHVDDLGKQTSIVAERPELFTWTVPSVADPTESFSVRARSIEAPGLRGEIYLFVHAYADGTESWVDEGWARGPFLQTYPDADLPESPESAICVNGLLWHRGLGYRGRLTSRIDFRRSLPPLGLGRGRRDPYGATVADPPELTSAWKDALQQHITETPRARGPDGWRYLQRLIEAFPLDEFWLDVPGTVPMYCDGARRAESIRAMESLQAFWVLLFTGPYASPARVNFAEQELPEDLLLEDDHPATMVDWEVNRLSPVARAEIFRSRKIDEARVINDSLAGFRWELVENGENHRLQLGSYTVHLGPVPDERLIGLPIHLAVDTYGPDYILNKDTAFVRWYRRVMEAGQHEASSITRQQAEALTDLVKTPLAVDGYEVEKLNDYLSALNRIDLPPELQPPDVVLDRSMFGRSTLSPRRYLS